MAQVSLKHSLRRLIHTNDIATKLTDVMFLLESIFLSRVEGRWSMSKVEDHEFIFLIKWHVYFSKYCFTFCGGLDFRHSVECGLHGPPRFG